MSLLLSWACAAVLVGIGAIGSSSRSTSQANSDRLLAAIAAAWLIAALLSALIGLVQYFGLSFLFEPWVFQTPAGRAYANLRQPNQFATLINIGLVALIWWQAGGPSGPALAAGANGVASPSKRAAAPVAAAILLAMGNAASSSRTGMVQMALLISIPWMWNAGVWRQAFIQRILSTYLIAYAVAALVLPTLAGLDFDSTGLWSRMHDGQTCTGRLTLWSNVLQLIAQKPWLGWGWEELDYAHFITLYSGERFCGILNNAHNLPLHLAVELGIPVAVLATCTGLWLIGRAKPWRETNLTRQMAWAVVALILLHSMLEFPLWYGPFQTAFGLCIWILWQHPGHGLTSPGKLRRSSPQVARALTAGLFLAFLGYAAWDYDRVSQIFLPRKMRTEAYRLNTLEKIQDSWLFQGQVQYAELVRTELSGANARHMNALAKQTLHFSPEALVAERLIESAILLNQPEEEQFYRVRYQAAFPEKYALWSAKNALPMRSDLK